MKVNVLGHKEGHTSMGMNECIIVHLCIQMRHRKGRKIEREIIGDTRSPKKLGRLG
jgi:hypothetical protein